MDTTPTTPPPPPTNPLSARERLKQARAKIDQRLRQIDARDSAAKRKAETHGKVILGALALGSPALVVQLAAKASERDRAHLAALGWLAAPAPVTVAPTVVVQAKPAAAVSGSAAPSPLPLPPKPAGPTPAPVPGAVVPSVRAFAPAPTTGGITISAGVPRTP
jgi:hypothetical protein